MPQSTKIIRICAALIVICFVITLQACDRNSDHPSKSKDGKKTDALNTKKVEREIRIILIKLTIITKLKLAAKRGDVEAQFKLGLIYGGLLFEDVEAVKWFRKAAEQGHMESQVMLGYQYLTGKGLLEDNTEAVKWFTKAAEQGSADAQYALGDRYMRGEGVAQDKAEAVKWYRKAAEQGHLRSQTTLGAIYIKAKDETEAVTWYRKAAEQGSAEAQYNLGTIFRDIVRDEDEAMKWFTKAAEQRGNSIINRRAIQALENMKK